ncbi:hypothetical protein TI05_04640 [Achromatium sp. WMS3]|nr:hypothetical protein TI05_04640 [Achromatium sp. WMS3]
MNDQVDFIQQDSPSESSVVSGVPKDPKLEHSVLENLQSEEPKLVEALPAAPVLEKPILEKPISEDPELEEVPLAEVPPESALEESAPTLENVSSEDSKLVESSPTDPILEKPISEKPISEDPELEEVPLAEIPPESALEESAPTLENVSSEESKLVESSPITEPILEEAISEDPELEEVPLVEGEGLLESDLNSTFDNVASEESKSEKDPLTDIPLIDLPLENIATEDQITSKHNKFASSKLNQDLNASDNEFLSELESTLTPPKVDTAQKAPPKTEGTATPTTAITDLIAYWNTIPRWLLISIILTISSIGIWQTNEWIDRASRLDATNKALNDKLTEALNRIDILKENLINIKFKLQKLEQRHYQLFPSPPKSS